jgi:hypothetical protein
VISIILSQSWNLCLKLGAQSLIFGYLSCEIYLYSRVSIIPSIYPSISNIPANPYIEYLQFLYCYMMLNSIAWQASSSFWVLDSSFSLGIITWNIVLTVINLTLTCLLNICWVFDFYNKVIS